MNTEYQDSNIDDNMDLDISGESEVYSEISKKRANRKAAKKFRKAKKKDARARRAEMMGKTKKAKRLRAKAQKKRDKGEAKLDRLKSVDELANEAAANDVQPIGQDNTGGGGGGGAQESAEAPQEEAQDNGAQDQSQDEAQDAGAEEQPQEEAQDDSQEQTDDSGEAEESFSGIDGGKIGKIVIIGGSAVGAFFLAKFLYKKFKK